VGDRSFLANRVETEVLASGGAAWFEVTLYDAWAYSTLPPVRTRGKVQVLTFDNVVVEDRKSA
jgi:hypothetical protein